MTTLNNFKSTTIRGLLKNSDFPDGSELADAIFERNITVNNNVYCYNLNSNTSNLSFVVNGTNSNFDTSGNFNCNHKIILNNTLVSNANDTTGLTFENTYYGNIYSYKGMVCQNGFYVKNSPGSSATTYALIDNNGNSQFARLTTSNVIRTSTTSTPSTYQDLGFITLLTQSSFTTSSITTSLTTVKSIIFNGTPYSYGTYGIKFCFSGSGSISQTLTYTINTTNTLSSRNAKHTTNTNFSCHHYDLTFNIYSNTTLYFLAQTSTGTYTISDGYIEIVRIA